MKILLINHYAGAPALGMELRPFYLAREWRNRGHSVQIVAASFSHLRQHQPTCPRKHHFQVMSDVAYFWLRVPSYHGNGLGRVRNMLAFLLRLWRSGPFLAKEFRPDVVIASSTYPADIFPARRIAKAASAQLVFEVHDLWPLSPQILADIPAWHPFIVFMQWAEDYACRWSDRVISIPPLTKEYLMERGMAPDKFAHISNGVAVEEWKEPRRPLPETHREYLATLRAQRKFILLYAGAHGLANSLGTLVQAASLLQSSAIHVVLVGDGPEKEKLIESVHREGWENVTFLPAVAKEALPSLLAQADALVLCLRKSPLFRYGISPNKLWDYMMSAKPILHAVEAGNDPVQDARCGVSVEPENPQALAQAARRLAGYSEEERAAMGARGREYVLQHCDYKVLARRFLEVLQKGKR